MESNNQGEVVELAGKAGKGWIQLQDTMGSSGNNRQQILEIATGRGEANTN